MARLGGKQALRFYGGRYAPTRVRTKRQLGAKDSRYSSELDRVAMCGLAGIFQHSGVGEEATAAVTRMADAISHRGPDDFGTWSDANAGIVLAHRRLSIIDPSAAGHQPMVSGSGRYVIVYNGELYNFQELRREFEQQAEGMQWRSNCDTEVLLAAIDRWGVADALKRLNGMFAFAVWDRRRRVLTLARDRFGEKPIFYGSIGGAFLFGSELKALTSHPRFNASVDRDAAAHMLRHDYVPAPRTIWDGVAKLRPGQYVEISDGGRRVQSPLPYWNLHEVATRGSAAALAAGPELSTELDKLLKDAVARQMIADVPLGAFLSGGVDSSLIVALMQTQSARPVRTFTIGFDDPAVDEAPFARAVASHLGTDHTELYLDGQDALDIIPQLPRIWDEPLGDQAVIPTYLVSELTRRHVKVALSGDGGDELFGGYSRYRSTWREWQRISRIPPLLRSGMRSAATVGRNGAFVPGDVGRAMMILSSPSLRGLYEWKRSRVDRPECLVLGASGSVEMNSEETALSLDGPSSMMLWDSSDFLADDLLAKVDRASMAVSLEVRAPFLDHRVAEFAWRLPLAEKVGGRQGKVILRRLLNQYLPNDLTSRAKMGFKVPMERWLKGPLRGWAEDLLSDDKLKDGGVLDPAGVRVLWNKFLDGKPRHERIVWNILSLQAWLNEAK